MVKAMEQKHDLTKPFERSGEWYVPTQPTERKAGQLRYEIKSISLDLIDGFTPMGGTIRTISPLIEYPIIHGITHLGEAVTLFGTMQTNAGLRFNSGGLRRPETIIARMMIVGAHYNELPLIDNLSFRIPGLELWQAKRNFEQSYENDAQTGKNTQKFTAHKHEPERYAVGGIAAELTWHYWYHSQCDTITGIDAGVSAWVSIKTSEPQPLSWFIEQIGSLQILLSLLTGTSMSMNGAEISLRPGISAHVYYPQFDYKICTLSHPMEFFTLHPQIEIEFGLLLSNWLDLFPKIETALQLASSAMNSTDLWTHVRFLTYMQALEGIHRGLFDGLYTTEEKYAPIETALKSAIPNDVGADHRASLKSRIKYGNEVSLRRRLNDLSAQVSPLIRKVTLGTENGVRGKWVDTRNYFSHGAALGTEILEGQELFDTNVRLDCFIRLLIFKLLGIPDVAAEHTLSRDSRLARHVTQIALREQQRTDPNFNVENLPIIAEINPEHLDRQGDTPEEGADTDPTPT